MEKSKKWFCRLLWFLVYLMIGITCYYKYVDESWRLFPKDINLILHGYPDFLCHGKRVILAWMILGVVVIIVYYYLHRKKHCFRGELLGAVICMILGGIYIAVDVRTPQRNDSWKTNDLIAHALGEVDGKKGTGSLEAFQSSYEKGMRCFESDMIFTADGEIVLAHDWKRSRKMQPGLPEEEIPTTEEFLNNLIYEKYTPMTFKDLCRIMKEHPDMYLVTDSKYTDEERIEKEFRQVLAIVKELDAEEILDRL